MSGIIESVLWSGHGLRHRLRRWSHKGRLERLDARDEAVAAALEREGGCTTDLGHLGIARSDEMMSAADRLMREMGALPKQAGKKSYLTAAGPELIARYPEIIRWGLDERLLAIAERYHGMPVVYRGVLARLDFPDGQVEETRIWHLDQEDDRIMKIIVYVNDVTDEGGPFEFIPASTDPPLSLAKGPKLRVDDEAALQAAVDPARWKAVTGPRGTVAFADTCAVLHRGRLPTAGARQTLFYCYNSKWPFRPTYCEPMFPLERFAAAAGPLTQRQRDALAFDYIQG